MTVEVGLLRRAATGATFVALRSVCAQLLGLGAMIVIARSLSKADFGVLAAGLAVTAFASAIADVGLAAGLIRGPRSPTQRELRAALGLQLVTLTAIAMIAGAVTLNFGRVGLVTCVMVLSLPLVALQTPARVLLERELAYRRLAAVEVLQALTFSAIAVTAVVLGLGIWGVAVASVGQAVVATVMLLWTTPEARLWPRWNRRDARELVVFGLKFQAVNLANLVRDHGLNLGVAVVLGLPALGTWNLATRVLQVPMTLFGAVWRVSYPTMSRVVRINERPRDVLEAAAAYAAIGSGLVLAPLGGAAALTVPVVFGSRWSGVAYTVAPACAALLIGAPISLTVAGFLYARSALRAVLVAVVAHTAAWFVVAIPLLPVLGVPAVGIGLVAGSVIDAVILARAASNWAGAHIVRPLVGPWLAALLAGSGAFGASTLLHPSPATATTTCIATVVSFLGLLELLSRLPLAAASPSPVLLSRRLIAAIDATAATSGSVVTIDARAS